VLAEEEDSVKLCIAVAAGDILDVVLGIIGPMARARASGRARRRRSCDAIVRRFQN